MTFSGFLALALVLLPAVPSADCSAVGPESAAWRLAKTSVFEMHVPLGYVYRPVEAKDGLIGKWVRKGKGDQSAIIFTLSAPFKPQAEYTNSTCSEIVDRREARVETGIGPTGRYFVRITWLQELAGYPGLQLVVWADTANPAEQLEALAALRTIKVLSNGGA